MYSRNFHVSKSIVFLFLGFIRKLGFSVLDAYLYMSRALSKSSLVLEYSALIQVEK